MGTRKTGSYHYIGGFKFGAMLVGRDVAACHAEKRASGVHPVKYAATIKQVTCLVCKQLIIKARGSGTLPQEQVNMLL